MVPNAEGLVNYCKQALLEKWGYVWGTFGQVLTPDMFAQKAIQYPDGIGNHFEFIRTHWVGKKTADCVGLIKGYYWTTNGTINYDGASDASADSMYTAAREKGSIGSIPDIPGICVCKSGHIGVYIGNGQVIEEHGTEYGIIQTPLVGGTPWTRWLKCPWIDYGPSAPGTVAPLPASESPVGKLQIALNAGGFTDKNGHLLVIDGDLGTHMNESLEKVTLGPGSKNPVVGWVQDKLSITVDDDYGKPPYHFEIYNAVEKWQTEYFKNVDYIIGINTIKSLL